jgi:hypothetical protein
MSYSSLLQGPLPQLQRQWRLIALAAAVAAGFLVFMLAGKLVAA